MLKEHHMSRWYWKREKHSGSVLSAFCPLGYVPRVNGHKPTDQPTNGHRWKYDFLAGGAGCVYPPLTVKTNASSGQTKIFATWACGNLTPSVHRGRQSQHKRNLSRGCFKLSLSFVCDVRCFILCVTSTYLQTALKQVNSDFWFHQGH